MCFQVWACEMGRIARIQPTITNRMSVFDDFNRPDNPDFLGNAVTGQLWEVGGVSGKFKIIANKAQRQNIVSTNAYYNMAYVESGLSDCVVTIDVTAWSLGSSSISCLGFRMVDHLNMLFISTKSGVNILQVYKCVNGVFTLLLDTINMVGGIAVYKIVLRGENIVVLRNGVEVININEPYNKTATKHGFGGKFGASTQVNNFSVEAL